jgi:hypothetical protein
LFLTLINYLGARGKIQSRQTRARTRNSLRDSLLASRAPIAGLHLRV